MVMLSVGMLFVLFLVPLTHLIDDLSRLKERTQRSHPIKVEYDSFRLSASRLANLL